MSIHMQVLIIIKSLFSRNLVMSIWSGTSLSKEIKEQLKKHRMGR